MSAISATGKRPRGHARVVLFSSIAAIGGFLFGFDTAIINGAVDPIEKSFHLNSVGIGVVVSITLFGAAIGAFSTGWVADRIGRPRVMLISAIVFAIAAVGCGLSTGLWDLSLWRLLVGLSVGAVTVIGPLYISEVAPAHIRGRLSSLQQMAIVLGIFAALLSDATIAAALSGADALTFLGLPAWRWMFMAGVIPAVIYGAASFIIPESPRYLVARGRDSEARRVLQILESEPAEQAEAKVLDIRRTIDATTKPRFKDLLAKRTVLLPIVWVGIGLAALQSLTGIDVIFYYSTSLWQSVGFSEAASFGLSVFSSVVNVVATVVAILLIDKVGRRRLLLAGSVGMFVSLTLVAIGFSTATTVDGNPTLGGAWGVITLIAANVFVIAFAVSWGPVVWVLLGEMFPNRIRGVALSVAATANWTCEVILNLSFPTLRDISLPGSYAIYAAMALASWFLVYYGVRETRDRELEDMTASVHVADVRSALN